jgi:hypothetical protein
MPKAKYDGVVEAVHYGPDGKVAWVRVYERRGAIFSDRIVIDRNTFVERLQAGRIYFAGRRVPQMAGTFETTAPVRLLGGEGDEILVSGEPEAGREYLKGVPVI